ncbi:major facilitator superfamily domain-containing protein [Syncephalis fuscata]|nr:major facilitator superfamily domain-containing protein [Syncephalis fuscata]
MVKDFHLSDDPKETGYYVGLLASAFSIAQCISGIPWGWLSDRIGRRPVVLVGLLTTTTCTIAFGFSKSYHWALTTRVLAGLGNGNVAVLKSMVAEISDKTNQARAFSFIPLSFVMGSIFGPLIGGILADPAHQYPDTIGKIPILRQYPYLLPCIVCASIAFVGFIMAFLFLEETLHLSKEELVVASNNSHQAVKPNEQSSLLRTEQSGQSINYLSNTVEDGSSEDLLPIPAMQSTLMPLRTNDHQKNKFIIPTNCWPPILFYALLSFQSIICDELTPLWLATPIIDGGLDFNSFKIGAVLSICAVVTLTTQLLGFAPLQYRLGSWRLFRWSMLLAVPAFLLLPYTNLLVRTDNDDEHQLSRMLMWPAVLLGVGWRLGLGVLSFTSVNLIVIDAARQAHTLGTVNAVAQCSSYLMRSIGPIICGTLWSWSLTNELNWPFDTRFVWLLLGLASFLTYVAAGRWLVADTAPCNLIRWENDNALTTASEDTDDADN